MSYSKSIRLTEKELDGYLSNIEGMLYRATDTDDGILDIVLNIPGKTGMTCEGAIKSPFFRLFHRKAEEDFKSELQEYRESAFKVKSYTLEFEVPSIPMYLADNGLTLMREAIERYERRTNYSLEFNKSKRSEEDGFNLYFLLLTKEGKSKSITFPQECAGPEKYEFKLSTASEFFYRVWDKKRWLETKKDVVWRQHLEIQEEKLRRLKEFSQTLQEILEETNVRSELRKMLSQCRLPSIEDIQWPFSRCVTNPAYLRLHKIVEECRDISDHTSEDPLLANTSDYSVLTKDIIR